jgi:hypothetical protein
MIYDHIIVYKAFFIHEKADDAYGVLPGFGLFLSDFDLRTLTMIENFCG